MIRVPWRVFAGVSVNLSGKFPAQHFAGFAAKEAVLKAIGTGWSAGVKWTDMEVHGDGGVRREHLWKVKTSWTSRRQQILLSYSQKRVPVAHVVLVRARILA
jgi:phosphopantetheinyl transferase (holo-ACP synthase)